MKLSQFLVKAKIHTYASGMEERELKNGSKELSYGEDEFAYRDRYFGFNPFAGQEVVWYKEKVVWVMNYRGRVLSERIPPKKVYQFLRKALRQVKENKPFRGPDHFAENDWTYVNQVEGSVKNFKGIEKIFFRGKPVYELGYHGGVIKS
jgi:hypothetical protein